MLRAGVSCIPARGKKAKGIGKGVADGTAVPIASGVMVGGSARAHSCFQFYFEELYGERCAMAHQHNHAFSIKSDEATASTFTSLKA